VPQDDRSARFVCSIACAFPNGEIITRTANIEGYIGYEQMGEHGFGYDPIFWVPEFNCSTAQLTAEQKNKISHRSKALEAMKYEIRRRDIL
jgi:XTP/dITP diphosphohydrolase